MPANPDPVGSPATIRVLLVDDHPVLRSGLRLIFGQQPDLAVVAEAGDGPTALERVKEFSPDVVVMDVHLPGEDGIRVSRRILDAFPQTRIVVLSAAPEMSFVNEALQAGVLGYVLKECGPEELLRAVRMAMEGRLYLSPEVNALVLHDYRKMLIGATSPSESCLSLREEQTLKLIGKGLRNKEIAIELDVSPKSVETYKRRLMAKLGLRSVAELVRYADRAGLTGA